ncbi:MAG TPA: glycosyltransferase family 2 protein [Candidatus Bathyarchaeia archaeon]
MVQSNRSFLRSCFPCLLSLCQCRVESLTFASTVVVCAHNEESYIEECLRSILAQSIPPYLILVVLDRCNDRTEEITRTVLGQGTSLVLEKQDGSWQNSIPEDLELALSRAIGEALVVIDADMTVPPDFLEKALPQLDDCASVSALAVTDPSQGFLNRLVSVWEKTYRVAPLGEQPRGGCRAISLKALKEIGGFRDTVAWDTDLDLRLRKAGYRVRMDRHVVVLHRRKMTTRGSISYQISAGKYRRKLGVGVVRTALHAMFRLRPFVIYGYLKKDQQPAPGRRVRIVS